MKKPFLCLLLVAINISALFSQSIQSPESFLGYPLGAKFTWHHQMVDYIKHVAAQSPKVKLIPYGKTTEGRELISLAITAGSDMPALEMMRQNNLKQTGLLKGEIKGKVKPIVYLSYNIHGNEAASTEAAMATIYYLAMQDTAQWLDDLIVVIDPCVNPDGRDRYVNWYKQARQATPQVNSESWEHNEPWPGGRYNHYLFDMNRDWCWQTQHESRLRSANYQRWMPQVHIDFHEMRSENSYFFAPPARPLHKLITPWQRAFHQHLGENHARYFDEQGWLYFTKETYDLFYPSYGDTWPTFQGAIGLTYEQGGSGRAGLAYETATGDTLTLLDRLTHHYYTSLSTIEVAWKQREKLMSEFKAFYQRASNEPPGTYRTYIIKASNPGSRIIALLNLLDKNQIRYFFPKNSGNVIQAFSYQENKNTDCKLGAKDIIISAFQPQAHLVQALFEPEPELEDSLTYDLTAWALPYAYGLEAYAYTGRIDYADPNSIIPPFDTASSKKVSEDVYAFLLPWQDASDISILAQLHLAKIKVRVAYSSFTVEEKEFGRGTLIITRTDNPGHSKWDDLMEFAQANTKKLYPVSTGLVTKGKDLGSNDVNFIKPPKLAIVNGEGVSATAFGELWFLLEQDFQYPVSILPSQNLGGIDLSKYDVLILPAGSYNKFQSKLLAFVKQGGRLILVERAIDVMASFPKDADPQTKLAKAMTGEKKESPWSKNNPDALLKRYEDRRRSRISESVPGSIYQVSLDESHPLAFGEDSSIHLIKRNSKIYPYLPEGGWNVGVYKDGKPISGFAGVKLQQKIKGSLSIGVESLGKGKIIYFVDSPVFRNFWHSGKLLIGNAIFMP